MISSKDNNKIKHIKKLLEKSKTRREERRFVIEGFKAVREAVKRGLVDEIFLSEDVVELCDDLDVTDVVSSGLFKEISDTVTPQGILAIVRFPEYDIDELFSNKNCKLVCLEDVRDPGNIGTIIRTAEGAGMDGVMLSKGCADVYQPKVTRATMGSVLRVPCIVCEDDLTTELDRLKKSGFTLFGAYLDGAVDYREPDYGGKVAVLIGNEANGLTDETVAKCDKLIKIPMKGELESLNAAVSAAILSYEVDRHR